ncbi:SGNH/GDSL hydrolase family protein [Streptomyces sp. NPDC098789]|uniref:SGNH/GDSL hydrolase family protein n=1 Tax=Streptomyces sp. NPDC098789 TaxID=3366098 RepID=UPI003808E44D
MNHMDHTTDLDHTPRPARSGMRRATALSAAALLGVLALTSCGNGSGSTDDAAATGADAARQDPSASAPATGTGTLKKPAKLLWMGDSIAVGEALPVTAALKSSDIAVTSMASDGGGGVLGPTELSESTWKALADQLKSVHPDTVAYQITTYDWGSPQEQRQGFEKLIATVKAAGAHLVLVTPPPFDTSGFYADHKADIDSAPGAAKAAVAAHPADASFLDASALWGTDATAPQAQRSSDKTHSCQQGTAKFAQWFSTELGRLAGFSPADPKGWANGEWTKSDVFAKLNCS